MINSPDASFLATQTGRQMKSHGSRETLQLQAVSRPETHSTVDLKERFCSLPLDYALPGEQALSGQAPPRMNSSQSYGRWKEISASASGHFSPFLESGSREFPERPAFQPSSPRLKAQPPASQRLQEGAKFQNDLLSLHKRFLEFKPPLGFSPRHISALDGPKISPSLETPPFPQTALIEERVNSTASSRRFEQESMHILINPRKRTYTQCTRTQLGQTVGSLDELKRIEQLVGFKEEQNIGVIFLGKNSLLENASKEKAFNIQSKRTNNQLAPLNIREYAYLLQILRSFPEEAIEFRQFDAKIGESGLECSSQKCYLVYEKVLKRSLPKEFYTGAQEVRISVRSDLIKVDRKLEDRWCFYSNVSFSYGDPSCENCTTYFILDKDGLSESTRYELNL